MSCALKLITCLRAVGCTPGLGGSRIITSGNFIKLSKQFEVLGIEAELLKNKIAYFEYSQKVAVV